jgi:hypothetical protein
MLTHSEAKTTPKTVHAQPRVKATPVKPAGSSSGAGHAHDSEVAGMSFDPCPPKDKPTWMGRTAQTGTVSAAQLTHPIYSAGVLVGHVTWIPDGLSRAGIKPATAATHAALMGSTMPKG